MSIKNTFLAILLTVFYAATLTAQVTQVLRGTITDKQSETPLIGAAVQIVGSTPILGDVTDVNGNFKIAGVTSGRYNLQISFVGYNTATLPNIVVNAGKETVLTISLEESVSKLAAVEISGKKDKTESTNELATISAHQFNVEDVRRYAGGSGDVSRLVSNFAGVATANDSRNDIVIRGNSPTGVLWRIEGIPVPNPNHFSTLGTTGGPVSALNPNMIRNSDFLTSAFPAEYGNATAGVFDIGFRKGNREKFETTLQVGAFTGFEGMIEGPLFKRDELRGESGELRSESQKNNSQLTTLNSQLNKGSFVLAYRKSFVDLAQKAGLNVGTASTPLYQDVNFNIDFGQSKMGNFSLFGIGGYSHIDFLKTQVDSTDFFAKSGEDSYAVSKLGVLGLRHNYLINNSTYIRTIVSGSYSSNTFNVYRDSYGEVNRHTFDSDDQETSYRVSSFINKKFNAQWTTRTGILYQNLGLNTFAEDRRSSQNWFQLRNYDGSFNLWEVYNQTQFKPTDKITINGGLHFQYLDLNKSSAIEPRLAFNYHFSPTQTFNIGYGLHSQAQPLPVLFYQERQLDGKYVNNNRNLDFTQSHHFVVGYDVRPSAEWHIKSEVYYQILRNVPIQSTPSTFSGLNSGADFGFPDFGSLVNKGEGSNKGIELTIEKFFSEGWYMLATGSVFDSKYKGSDGVERNTAFNGKYVGNFLAGKEIKFGATKNKAFTIDTKVTFAGGRPFIPVNLAASEAAGTEVLDSAQAYTQNLGDYFRWDVKFGININSTKRKFTQTFFLDFHNVTAHKNIFASRYSVVSHGVYNVYQSGFLPDVLYRVQF